MLRGSRLPAWSGLNPLPGRSGKVFRACEGGERSGKRRSPPAPTCPACSAVSRLPILAKFVFLQARFPRGRSSPSATGRFSRALTKQIPVTSPSPSRCHRRGFAPGHALEGDAGRPACGRSGSGAGARMRSGRRPCASPAEEREEEDDQDEDALLLGTALRYPSARPLLPAPAPLQRPPQGAPVRRFEAQECCQGADQFEHQICI